MYIIRGKILNPDVFIIPNMRQTLRRFYPVVSPRGPSAPFDDCLRGDAKREQGRFYTISNPFAHPAFSHWAELADLQRQTILEPFAGCNHLIDHLSSLNLCADFRSYDIEPAHPDVVARDTLRDFPTGYRVCVTNPPWLAKNSATRRGLSFVGDYDDLYQFALSLCLAHCDYVAALIPESFVRAAIFRTRLMAFISLTSAIFSDTDHPVGLALFVPQRVKATHIWLGLDYAGRLNELERMRPHCSSRARLIRFNDPQGELGFFAIDNCREPSIRFCPAAELADYPVKFSCRSITRISVPWRLNIAGYNRFIKDFRHRTRDVLLTPFKGLRRDGFYRRRMDYALARAIIANV